MLLPQTGQNIGQLWFIDQLCGIDRMIPLTLAFIAFGEILK